MVLYVLSFSRFRCIVSRLLRQRMPPLVVSGKKGAACCVFKVATFSPLEKDPSNVFSVSPPALAPVVFKHTHAGTGHPLLSPMVLVMIVVVFFFRSDFSRTLSSVEFFLGLRQSFLFCAARSSISKPRFTTRGSWLLALTGVILLESCVRFQYVPRAAFPVANAHPQNG